MSTAWTHVILYRMHFVPHAFCTVYWWNMWSVHALCCATLGKLATFPSGSLVSRGVSCSIDGQFTSWSQLSKQAVPELVSSLAALIRMKKQLWLQTKDASDMWDSSFVRCTHSAVLSVTPCRCTVQKKVVNIIKMRFCRREGGGRLGFDLSFLHCTCKCGRPGVILAFSWDWRRKAWFFLFLFFQMC